MPIINLAEEIGRYLPGRQEATTTGSVGGVVAATVAGGILGSLLGGSSKSDS
jgi:hypothetical protein